MKDEWEALVSGLVDALIAAGAAYVVLTTTNMVAMALCLAVLVIAATNSREWLARAVEAYWNEDDDTLMDARQAYLHGEITIDEFRRRVDEELHEESEERELVMER